MAHLRCLTMKYLSKIGCSAFYFPLACRFFLYLSIKIKQDVTDLEILLHILPLEMYNIKKFWDSYKNKISIQWVPLAVISGCTGNTDVTYFLKTLTNPSAQDAPVPTVS